MGPTEIDHPSIDIPRIIFFDYGGVIADHYSQPYLSKLAQTLQSSEEATLAQLSERTPHGKAYRIDAMSMVEFWTIIKDQLRVGMFDFETAQSLWAKTYIPNCAMLALTTFLREQIGIRVGLLLNEDRVRLLHVNAELATRCRFDYVFASCDLGFVKPSAEFYEAVYGRIDSSVDRNAILIVDDRQTHVDVPRELGFQTYKFVNSGNFSRFISKFTNYG